LAKWQVLAAALLLNFAVKVLLPAFSPVTTKVALACCWPLVSTNDCASAAAMVVAPVTAKLM